MPEWMCYKTNGMTVDVRIRKELCIWKVGRFSHQLLLVTEATGKRVHAKGIS
jgi:hypothetical protein